MIRFRHLLPLLAAGLLAGCYKKDIAFGTDMADSYTQVFEVDTLTVQTSTYRLDSFATNHADAFLAGRLADPQTGVTEAVPCFQVVTPYSYSIPADAVFDSLTFTFTPNGYSYGDTLAPVAVELRQLAEPLDFRYGSSIYNSSVFAEQPQALGTATLQLRPSQGPVRIRLSNSRGAELFQALRENRTDVADTASFVHYFKGLALHLRPQGDAAVYGLTRSSDSVYLRLHYHSNEPLPTEASLDISLYNNTWYNRIRTDRSSTVWNSAVNPLPAGSSGDAALVQAGTGTLLKLNFPGARSLLQLGTTVRLLKATLQLRVKPGSYNPLHPLPATLQLAQTDNGNALGAAIVSSDGLSIQKQSPFEDQIYGVATTYSFDVTSFLSTLINTAGSEATGLFVLNSSPGTSARIDRVLINGPKDVDGSKLQLTFLTLNQ